MRASWWLGRVTFLLVCSHARLVWSLDSASNPWDAARFLASGEQEVKCNRLHPDEAIAGCPFDAGRKSPCIPGSSCFDYSEPSDRCQGPENEGFFGQCCDEDDQCESRFCHYDQRACSVTCREDNECPISAATGLQPTCVKENSGDDKGVCDARSRIDESGYGYCTRCLGQPPNAQCESEIVDYCSRNLETDSTCQRDWVASLMTGVLAERTGEPEQQQGLCPFQPCNYNGICEAGEDSDSCPYDCGEPCPFDKSLDGSPCHVCNLTSPNISSDCINDDAITDRLNFAECCDDDSQCSSGVCDWERRTCTFLCTGDAQCPPEPMTGIPNCALDRSSSTGLCAARSSPQGINASASVLSSSDNSEGYCSTCIGPEPSEQCIDSIKNYCEKGANPADMECNQDWVQSILQPLPVAPQPRFQSPTKRFHFYQETPIRVALSHDDADASVMFRITPMHEFYRPYVSAVELSAPGEYLVQAYASARGYQMSSIIRASITVYEPLPSPTPGASPSATKPPASPSPSRPPTLFSAWIEPIGKIIIPSDGVSEIPLKIVHNVKGEGAGGEVTEVEYEVEITDERIISKTGISVRGTANSKYLEAVPHRHVNGTSMIMLKAIATVEVPEAYELPAGSIRSTHNGRNLVTVETGTEQFDISVNTNEKGTAKDGGDSPSTTATRFASAHVWGFGNFRTFSGFSYRYMGLGPHLIFSDSRHQVNVDALMERYHGEDLSYISAISVSSKALRRPSTLSPASLLPSVVMTGYNVIVDGKVIELFKGRKFSTVVGSLTIRFDDDKIALTFVDGSFVSIQATEGGFLYAELRFSLPDQELGPSGLCGGILSSYGKPVMLPDGSPMDLSRMDHYQIFYDFGRMWNRTVGNSWSWEEDLIVTFGRDWNSTSADVPFSGKFMAIHYSTLYGTALKSVVQWELITRILGFHPPGSMLLEKHANFDEDRLNASFLLQGQVECPLALKSTCMVDYAIIKAADGKSPFMLDLYHRVLRSMQDSVESLTNPSFSISFPSTVKLFPGSLSYIRFSARTNCLNQKPPSVRISSIAGKHLIPRNVALEQPKTDEDGVSHYTISVIPSSGPGIGKGSVHLEVSQGETTVNFIVQVTVTSGQNGGVTETPWVKSISFEVGNTVYPGQSNIPLTMNWKDLEDSQSEESLTVGDINLGTLPVEQDIAPVHVVYLCNQNVDSKTEVTRVPTTNDKVYVSIPENTDPGESYFLEVIPFSTIDVSEKSVSSDRFSIMPVTIWVMGEWSSCDSQCGPGKKIRDVRCVNNATMETEREYLCSSSTKPSMWELCNGMSCGDSEVPDFAFVSTPWSECSNDCDVGNRTRDLVCVSSDGMKSVHLSSCQGEMSQPPSTVEECLIRRCPEYQWKTFPWGECDATCGDGFRTRQVHCEEIHSQTIVTADHCGQKRPSVKEPCFAGECMEVKWEVSDWTRCNQTCGGGFQFRELGCVNSLNGTKASLTECEQNLDESPLSMRTCNSRACKWFVWRTSEWSICTGSSCNSGSRTRSVECIDYESEEKAHNSLCKQSSMPKLSEACLPSNCGPCNVTQCGRGQCHLDENSDPQCMCDDGWTGTACHIQEDSPCLENNGIPDSNGTCCLSKVLNSDGECCSYDIFSEPTRDASGECCNEEDVDACGVCGGNGQAIDHEGLCCRGVLAADRSCCVSGFLDACGVCDGDGSSCLCSINAEFLVNTSILPEQEIDAILVRNGPQRLMFKENVEPKVANALKMPMSSVSLKSLQEISQEPVLELNFAVLSRQQAGTPYSSCDSVENALSSYFGATPLYDGFSLESGSTTSYSTNECGNGVCENGESCSEDFGGTRCCSDCPQLLTCPSLTETECSGKGKCNSAAGTCSCDPGYTGEKCSKCSLGFTRVSDEGALPVSCVLSKNMLSSQIGGAGSDDDGSRDGDDDRDDTKDDDDGSTGGGTLDDDDGSTGGGTLDDDDGSGLGDDNTDGSGDTEDDDTGGEGGSGDDEDVETDDPDDGENEDGASNNDGDSSAVILAAVPVAAGTFAVLLLGGIVFYVAKLRGRSNRRGYNMDGKTFTAKSNSSGLYSNPLTAQESKNEHKSVLGGDVEQYGGKITAGASAVSSGGYHGQEGKVGGSIKPVAVYGENNESTTEPKSAKMQNSQFYFDQRVVAGSQKPKRRSRRRLRNVTKERTQLVDEVGTQKIPASKLSRKEFDQTISVSTSPEQTSTSLKDSTDNPLRSLDYASLRKLGEQRGSRRKRAFERTQSGRRQ